MAVTGFFILKFMHLCCGAWTSAPGEDRETTGDDLLDGVVARLINGDV